MSFTGSMTTQWERLAPRERQLFVVAGSLLALALAWWLLVAPAVQTWRTAGTAHAQLDAQIQQMQALAAEAKALKGAPRVTASQTQSWLDQSTKKLGKATLNMQGARAQISFTGASAENLAAFLAEARVSAALLPVQANWKRAALITTPTSASTKGDTPVLWDGSLVFEVTP
jgi:general secretion pathway protein M